MLLPALGRRSWAEELGSSQPIPIPFLSASLTLIKLPTSRVAPPLLWKVHCSQHVHHMCLQHPRLNIYSPIPCQQPVYATRTLALAGAGDWPSGAPASPLVAGGGWGRASDLYLIYFIGLFRARRLPLSASACSTFIGFGGKNKEYVCVCIYIFSAAGGEHKGRKTRLLHCFAARQDFRAARWALPVLQGCRNLLVCGHCELPFLVKSPAPRLCHAAGSVLAGVGWFVARRILCCHDPLRM